MMDKFKEADKIINEAYSDTCNKGVAWWSEQHIPNCGILRGAIVSGLQGSANQERKRIVEYLRRQNRGMWASEPTATIIKTLLNELADRIEKNNL